MKRMPRKAATVAVNTRRRDRAEKERVLVEFPSNLLERADRAAASLEKNRSELIRNAVEQLLDGIERKKFEAELAAAYAANSKMNLDLAEEFSQVDREGFE
jgi:metal-responsive CopG/Arc/MetJ family transcriptional regulator